MAKILRATPDIITVKQAAQTLGLTAFETAQQLALWNKQGWISRVRRGVYVPIALTATSSELSAEDPWIIAEELWRPNYIGGWSAAEHWHLTEQIFHATIVITTGKPRQRKATIKGASFLIRSIPPSNFFGTKPVWRGSVRVQVSDPAKTIIDMLDEPQVGGGVRPVMDVFGQYLHSSHRNLDLLLSYAEKQGNKTVYKRMGFLAESLVPEEKKFLAECQRRLSAGYSKLDPSLNCDRIVTRWKLRIPAGWKKAVSID